MSLLDAYARLLERRGTRGAVARPADFAWFRERHGELPDAIVMLLSVQDGEDALLTFGKGYRFMSIANIGAAMVNLREMVEEDETLPPAFLQFVPFLHTEVKTTVGVFREPSMHASLGVIEYQYESGEFVRWSCSIEAFTLSLASAASPFHRLGSCFPMPGLDVVDIHEHALQ